MTLVFTPAEVATFEHDVWSRCANGYSESFAPLTGEAIGPLLDAVHLAAGARVLDVGTGPGQVAAAIAQRGGNPVGIDFSEAMLEEARRRQPGIDFKLASAEALPFATEAFDAVVGNFVLHHSGNPVALLKETFRVLRAGGRIAFTVWADLTKLEAFGLFFGAMERHGLAGELPHGPLFGVSDFDVYQRMATEAGFRDALVRELSIAWRMSSIDRLLAAFGDWANMSALPAEVRAAVDADIRKASRRYESSGMLTIPNPAIIVSAMK
jgi:SAM-dependent methyltransferase